MDVWANTAYQSKENEAYLEKHNKVSRIHCKKPKGKPMLKAMARANTAKSKVRCYTEPVFAEQKDRMGLFICIIGIAWASAVMILVNITYNMKRWCFLERRTAEA